MRHEILKEEQEELQVLVVENHKLHFDITQILSVVLDFFNKTWNYAIILRDVFSNIEKHVLLH